MRHPMSGNLKTNAQMPNSSFYGTQMGGMNSTVHSRKLSSYKHTMTNLNLFDPFKNMMVTNFAGSQDMPKPKTAGGMMPGKRPRVQPLIIERQKSPEFNDTKNS